MPFWEIAGFEHESPAVPGSVAELRHAVADLLSDADVPAERAYDIELAVSEACTNVVRHAYDSDRPGPLFVAAAILDGRLRVVVRDEGRGMAPHPSTQGIGVGLPLIGRLADSVEIARGRTGRGTEVSMTFALVPVGEREPRLA